ARHWATIAAHLKELARAVEGDALGRILAPQRGVRLSVGDVEAETPLAQGDGLLGDAVVAEALDRLGGGAPPHPSRRGEQRERLGDVDGEDLLLGLEAPALLALLDVGTVATELRRNRLIVSGIVSDHARHAQHAERVFE